MKYEPRDTYDYVSHRYPSLSKQIRSIFMGKSQLIKKYCKENGVPVVDLPSHKPKEETVDLRYIIKCDMAGVLAVFQYECDAVEYCEGTKYTYEEIDSADLHEYL